MVNQLPALDGIAQAETPYMNKILVCGLRGSGKTTVAREMADQLGATLVDAIPDGIRRERMMSAQTLAFRSFVETAPSIVAVSQQPPYNLPASVIREFDQLAFVRRATSWTFKAYFWSITEELALPWPPPYATSAESLDTFRAPWTPSAIDEDEEPRATELYCVDEAIN